MSDLERVSQAVAAAARFVAPRRDPLTLDLDGDGLETTGISPTARIYFDHTGSGTKTATGWLKPDDAFLVLDRNGNGLIDFGRELFGDSTIKRDGQRAADGFDALRDLDSNADGKISALDSRFPELRLWRDLNQDGVSQSNEPSTLGQLNVASINVAASAHSQMLANGNQIADIRTYTRSDGSLGTTGEVTGNLADINLASNPFYRQFTDTLDTTAVADLPDLRGSGAVRDLREAATLSPALAATLATLTTTTPRAALQTAVAQVIEQWADSAAFSDSFETAAAAGRDLFFVPPGVSALDAYNARYVTTHAYTSLSGSLGSTPLSTDERSRYAAIRAQQANIERLLKTLEAFNGLPFAPIGGGSSTLAAVAGTGTPSGRSASPALYTLEQDRINLLQQSAQALNRSVYDGLALQTRLKPLLETLTLQIDADGIRLDFSALDAEIDARLTADSLAGFADVMDFSAATHRSLDGSGWSGWSKVTALLETHPVQASFRTLLADNGYQVKGLRGFTSGGTATETIFGENTGESLSAEGGDDGVFGLAGNDTGAGNGGNDTLDGGAGDDILYGNDGNDVLSGGAGNDRLEGGTGNDTVSYAFAPAGVNVSLALATGQATGGSGTDTLVSIENLTGGAFADQLTGNDGNNRLTGDAGNDTLDGGVGADTLLGGDGSDTYRVDQSGDLVVENNADLTTGGNDTVYSYLATYTLPANVENLSLQAAGPANAAGNALNNYLYASTGDNRLDGGAGSDTVSYTAATAAVTVSLAVDTAQATGGSGSDTLLAIEHLAGSNFNDSLTGNGLANTLSGGTGNDTLAGGAGSDRLLGGSGSDTYRLARGDGADTVSDNDATAGQLDVAQFAAGIAPEQLWFRRLGSHLEVSVIGTDDRLTVENWYAGPAWHLERFQTADNRQLLDSQVDALVQAMAAFAPPAAGQTTLPPSYQSTLAPLLAANWQ